MNTEPIVRRDESVYGFQAMPISPVRCICLSVVIGLQSAFCLAQEPAAFANGGFEDGITGWKASAEDAAANLSTVSPEAAHSGKNGLRVKQDENGPGSWIQSTKVPVGEGKNYRVNFWARCVQPSGIGVWVQFFDAEGKAISIPDPNLASKQIAQNATEWTEYHLVVAIPAGCVAMTISVHAYSHHGCLADFDDFTLAPTTETAGASASTASTPAVTVAATSVTPLPALDPARIREIASSLNPAPRGIGPSIDDRKAWEALGADPQWRDKLITRAGGYLNQPIPQISNDLWMQSCRTGNRTAEPLLDRRRFRLTTWVLAEGVENKGRFLPAIGKEIAAICSEPTWVLPAHDPKLLNYSGQQKFVDLGVGMTSWTLATADSMLGSRLSDSTRKMIRDKTRERIIEPYLDETHGKTHLEWWRTNDFNWNAVVHGGVAGVALALDDSIDERAEIIASIEKEVPFYLQGFPKDGYSTEGMGYWKYGFGHFIMLSEAVLGATHGKVNLYASEKARLAAQFPRRFEIVPTIYPAFADSAFMEEPSRWLYHIINCRYGLGDEQPRTIAPDGMFSAFLYSYGTNLTFDSAAPPIYTEGGNIGLGHRLRDWFAESQVMVDRLSAGETGINLAFKGGTNGAPHGHDDLGSYVVVLDQQPLMVDPGGTIYNGQTFSSHRYDNEILNSYGHSVPKVAGQLQKTGAQYYSIVLAKDFSDPSDSVTLDLTKGYDVPSLNQLTRRFDYVRANKGAVTVTDHAVFAAPQAFGTAVVTFGEATEEKPGVWTITQNGKAVRLKISAGALPFTVTNEVLKDSAHAGKVRRLGIDLNAPAADASITVTATPVI